MTNVYVVYVVKLIASFSNTTKQNCNVLSDLGLSEEFILFTENIVAVKTKNDIWMTLSPNIIYHYNLH